MAQRGTGVEYIFAEMQKIAAAEDMDEDLVGLDVVALRFGVGSDKPSEVFIIPTWQAQQLRDDLIKLLEDI